MAWLISAWIKARDLYSLILASHCRRFLCLPFLALYVRIVCVPLQMLYSIHRWRYLAYIAAWCAEIVYTHTHTLWSCFSAINLLHIIITIYITTYHYMYIYISSIPSACAFLHSTPGSQETMRFNKFNDPALTSFGNPNVLGWIPGLVSQVLRLHKGRIRELVDTAKSSRYDQGLGGFWRKPSRGYSFYNH